MFPESDDSVAVTSIVYAGPIGWALPLRTWRVSVPKVLVLLNSPEPDVQELQQMMKSHLNHLALLHSTHSKTHAHTHTQYSSV